MPICSLFAIIALVTGGPEVKFCHSNSNLMLAYLPSVGRYFSRRCSCRITTPAVTVLVVVSCVPMPMVTVSADAGPASISAVTDNAMESVARWRAILILFRLDVLLRHDWLALAQGQIRTCHQGGLVAAKASLHHRWAISLLNANQMCTNFNR